MVLYKDFRSNFSQYEKSTKIWESLVDVLIYKSNVHNWMNLNTRELDGNPIVVYYNHQLRRQIRIIQIDENEATKWNFSSWINDFGDENSFNGKELIISSILTEKNLVKSSNLITKWLENKEYDDMELTQDS